MGSLPATGLTSRRQADSPTKQGCKGAGGSCSGKFFNHHQPLWALGGPSPKSVFAVVSATGRTSRDRAALAR
ncbi:hypothetical protein [Spirosoma foliorum]|uniref:Uncharacterized protein n=1 Tax=Spirosoma foliorum TaxID=2710596 RepID=A0A7G5GYE2_9BACT|nr:hypothetical protein [Spirosoma foliorum]QMW03884.1 hypothetical protein H3H32_02700 [Spirosoma foliorum]